MREPRVITISLQTMVTGLLLVIAALLAFLLRDVIVTVFVATVLSAAIDPSITSLERRGLPRPIGLAILMFTLIGGVAFLAVTFFPLIVDQTQQFLAHLPEIYRRNLDQLRVNGYGHIARAIESGVVTLSQSADGAVRGFFGGALTAVRGMMSLFGVIVLTLYMVMGQKELKAGALELAAPRLRPRVSRLLREIKSRLGQWLRGQLLLGAVIGAVSYAGLSLLGVKFALVLAIVAGVTELIPVVGPILGAVPAILVAMSDRPILGLWVAVMYVAIQQLENHLLVPRIMSRATGLSPIAVIVAILIGAGLAGLLGVFIAVPAGIIVQVLLEDWQAGRRLREQELLRMTPPPPAPGASPPAP